MTKPQISPPEISPAQQRLFDLTGTHVVADGSEKPEGALTFGEFKEEIRKAIEGGADINMPHPGRPAPTEEKYPQGADEGRTVLSHYLSNVYDLQFSYTFSTKNPAKRKTEHLPALNKVEAELNLNQQIALFLLDECKAKTNEQLGIKTAGQDFVQQAEERRHQRALSRTATFRG